MMHNLIQIEMYLKEYCDVAKLYWCDREIVQYGKSIANFQKFAYKRAPNIDLIDQIDIMSEFANEKTKYFSTLWTPFDFKAFYGGIISGLWLVIFQVATVFSLPETKILAPRMSALSILTYLCFLYDWISLSIAAITIVGISII